jgi:biopolymer transport protein ExbB
MTTTVVGLVVGIIAYGLQSLSCKTDKIVHQMEANAVDF